MRILSNRERNVKIAVRSAVVTWTPMSGQFYFLPVVDSCRDGNPHFLSIDVKGLLVGLRRITKMKLEFRRNILSPEFTGSRSAGTPEPGSPAASKHALEEVGKVISLPKISGKTTTATLGLLILTLLLLCLLILLAMFPVFAIFVVLLTVFRTAQHFIGFIDFLKSFFGLLIAGIDVRVVLSGHFPVGFLNLFRSGRFCNP